ncbi:uncharacterized protein LOC110685527 [Chenopodium quinoa]|uniref:uncharacterized protein LOC110685527 n=1 Tax=Chenopodium quinoa TaxID=63459 RepID=UPI000B78E5C7|nr:uncharacterized protein LOC110685527 [Chenopodium quinoa]
MSSESPKTPIKGDNDEHTTSPPTDPCAWNDSGNVPCLYVRDRHTKDTMVVPETPDDVVLSMDDNLYPISTYSRRRKLFQSPSRLGDIDEKNISKTETVGLIELVCDLIIPFLSSLWTVETQHSNATAKLLRLLSSSLSVSASLQNHTSSSSLWESCASASPSGHCVAASSSCSSSTENSSPMTFVVSTSS